MGSYAVVLTTVSSSDEAKKISSAILEKRLCACVNIIPGLESFFHWQGKIDNAKELLLLIKTRKELFDELCAEIKSLHSYSVPEIIMLPIKDGYSTYLEWISGNVIERDKKAKRCIKVKQKHR